MSADDAVVRHELDDAAVSAAAEQIVAVLRARGVRRGDVVGVLAGNHPGAVAARDASAIVEAACAPINPRLAPAEVAWIVEHTRPAVVICDAAHAAMIEATRRIVIDDRSGALSNDALGIGSGSGNGIGIGIGSRSGPPIGATILFTSGTTGTPKACLRPAAAEAARVAELTSTYGLCATDVHLVACPLAHSAPGAFTRAARAAGARTVILDRFRPRAFLEALDATGATVCFLVPTQWYRLLELPAAERPRPASLRAAIVAGAPIAPATKDRLIEWLGPDRLHEFYGSSETGTITVATTADHVAHRGSVGRAPAGVELRILDDDGRDLPPGEDGEVFVRSDALMAGYLDADGRPTRPGERDGYLSCGDLGHLDAGGWLTLVDRKHDTIISGGANVYPAEVEAALAAHPAIAGAVVFGTDDPEWGQVVTAVVAPRGAATLTAADLTAFLRSRLAGYKLPRRWARCALDDLPVGSSGKALRRAARAAHAAGHFGPLA